MKITGIKKKLFLLVLVLLVAKVIATTYSNHQGRDQDNERTEKYLGSIKAIDSTAGAPPLPNIILILADDLGYGDLSSFGSTLIATPNIDELAKGGIKMTNFYAPSSLCSPARAGFLTGRYPQRAHVPAVLFDSGTAINTIRKYGGFYSYGMDGLAPDEATLSEVLQARGYRSAVIGKWHLGSTPGHLPQDNGFEFVYTPDASVEVSTLTRNFTEKSIQFITENHDSPFFLYYATTVPHEPLHRVEAFAGKTGAGMYGEMVQELDWSVGVIMEKLVELGIDDNTLVIFTSDNGPFRMGSTGGYRGGKGLTTMGGQRVPFVAYWPGTIPAQQVSNEMTMGIDIFPTALEMAGIPLPSDRVIDGRSILPLLKGDVRQTPHDYLFMMNDKTVESVLDKAGFKYQIPSSPDVSKFWYLKVGPYLFNIHDDPSESYSILEMNTDKGVELAHQIESLQQEFATNLRGWK